MRTRVFLGTVSAAQHNTLRGKRFIELTVLVEQDNLKDMSPEELSELHSKELTMIVHGSPLPMDEVRSEEPPLELPAEQPDESKSDEQPLEQPSAELAPEKPVDQPPTSQPELEQPKSPEPPKPQ
jgi:hypothetical protein